MKPMYNENILELLISNSKCFQLIINSSINSFTFASVVLYTPFTFCQSVSNATPCSIYNVNNCSPPHSNGFLNSKQGLQYNPPVSL